MKPELIQMLRHEDAANVYIGTMMAYHEKYSLPEIFGKLKPKSNSTTSSGAGIIIYEINDVRFQIQSYMTYSISLDHKEIPVYNVRFAVFKVNPIEKICAVSFVPTSQEHYNNILKHYQITFMEYVVGLKQ